MLPVILGDKRIMRDKPFKLYIPQLLLGGYLQARDDKRRNEIASRESRLDGRFR